LGDVAGHVEGAVAALAPAHRAGRDRGGGAVAGVRREREGGLELAAEPGDLRRGGAAQHLRLHPPEVAAVAALLVAPRPGAPVGAARRLLPLRLARQPLAGKRAVVGGVAPGDVGDRVSRIAVVTLVALDQ